MQRWMGEALVRELVRNGADVNQRGSDGCTPLTFHLRCGSGAGIIQVLIDAGADVNAPDDEGRTPISRCGEGEVRELLLKAGARKVRCVPVEKDGRYLVKSGSGWSACHDRETGVYTAKWSSCGSGGMGLSCYEITREIYEGLDDLDRYPVRLLRSGRELYRYVDDRCGVPYDVVIDKGFRKLFGWTTLPEPTACP